MRKINIRLYKSIMLCFVNLKLYRYLEYRYFMRVEFVIDIRIWVLVKMLRIYVNIEKYGSFFKFGK